MAQSWHTAAARGAGGATRATLVHTWWMHATRAPSIALDPGWAEAAAGAAGAAGAGSRQVEYEGFIGWVLSLMERIGEVGVGIAVLIETVFPPVPSEVMLPGAGFLAYEGRMSYWGALLAATCASLLGALLWYGLGAALGPHRTRALLEAVPLMDGQDMDRASAFFDRWGGPAVLVGRCVPLVRSVISVPAGIVRMRTVTFVVYTVIGSGVWNAIWIGLGFVFGPAIQPVLERWSQVLSNLTLAVIGALLVLFVLRRVRRNRRPRG